MKAKSSTTIYFAIEGNFLCDDLSSFLGMKPTKQENMGARGKVPKCSTWKVQDENHQFLKDCDNIFPIIETIVQRMMPIEERIVLARSRWDLGCVIQVVFEIYAPWADRLPAFGLDAEAVRFLGSVGGIFDIDSYYLPEEERDFRNQ